MSSVAIKPYTSDRLDEVINLTVSSWGPVFAKTANDVPRFVYDNFYPFGWEKRQTSDVRAMLEDGETDCWLACVSDSLHGFVGVRLHPEDKMGEIYILAVDPKHQRRGVGKQLLSFAEQKIRDAGMQMVMVETGGDSGHAPARKAYETSGYERWPVSRYFKRL